MDMPVTTVIKDKSARRWKIAFFVALFAFEAARETVVINANHPVRFATSAVVNSYGDYIVAQGRWVRMDGGGDRLIPNVTSIQCNRTDQTCRMTDVTAYNGYVSEPTTSVYNATFTPDSASFADSDPVCVTTSYRIDVKLKKAFEVRDKKSGVADKGCTGMESRIEGQLGDGWQKSDESLDGHFVPIFSLLKLIFVDN